MPRKKKVTVAEVPESAPEISLREENEQLRAEIAKLKPKRGKSTDGAVTFKSPWSKFEVVLKPGGYLATGLRSSVIISPVTAKFENQVCTFRPGDTFEETVEIDGKIVRKTVSKIERMREIYRRYVALRKRPQFVEVTEDSDLKIQSFRERIPPSALVEFKGPLVDLPAIPPLPPKEAQETIDTIERRRKLYA